MKQKKIRTLERLMSSTSSAFMAPFSSKIFVIYVLLILTYSDIKRSFFFGGVVGFYVEMLAPDAGDGFDILKISLQFQLRFLFFSVYTE